MRTYNLSIDSKRSMLPPLVEGTAGMLAHPRPNTPLTCVVAPHDRTFTSMGMDGEIAAEVTVPKGYYHVVSQVGFQFAVHPADIMGSVVAPYPAWTYEAVSAPTERDPAAPTLEMVWPNTTALLVTIWRRQPAKIVGEVAEDAEPGWLHTDGDNTRWRIFPGAWILWDVSHRNMRVSHILQLGREFDKLTGSGAMVTL